MTADGGAGTAAPTTGAPAPTTGAPDPTAGAPAPAVGIAALPDGSRVDFARLRSERRARLFDAMAASGIDVAVLGRPASVVYASGARQLWTAGARPFGPACVVVRATGRVHLLSTWDEGVPPEVAREDLFGLSWNPAVIAGRLRAIPGLADARRIATDGYSPGSAQLLSALAPGAELFDAGPVLARARAPRTTDELGCIVTAAAAAESALNALADALHPGVTERELVARYVEHIAALGLPTPPTEAVVCATPRSGPVALRRVPAGRAVGAGELVALSPGALYAGYQGCLARTRLSGPGEPTAAQRAVLERCHAALGALVAACRPGASGAALRAAWDATGEPPPPEPLAWGIGLGAETPVIGHGLGEAEVVPAGSVLAVQAWVAAEGAGGALEQDLVLVTEQGPEVLTRFGPEPRPGA